MMRYIVMEDAHKILYLSRQGWIRNKSNATFFTKDQAESICLGLTSNLPGGFIYYVEEGR